MSGKSLSTANRYILLALCMGLAISFLLTGFDLDRDHMAIAVLLGSCLLPVVTYLWIKADSAARAVKPPPGAIPLLVILLPIGWAYYVFATRRPMRASLTVLLGVVIGIGLLTVAALIRINVSQR
jgi:hypothetical protein